MIPCYGSHGNKQPIIKLILEEYKIWVRVTEAYGYVVQFRPYQGAKKRNDFASSTKWEYRENVVLRLIECLTPAFGLMYLWKKNFTSFCLLTHFGVNNI